MNLRQYGRLVVGAPTLRPRRGFVAHCVIPLEQTSCSILSRLCIRCHVTNPTIKFESPAIVHTHDVMALIDRLGRVRRTT